MKANAPSREWLGDSAQQERRPPVRSIFWPDNARLKSEASPRGYEGSQILARFATGKSASYCRAGRGHIVQDGMRQVRLAEQNQLRDDGVF